VGGGGRGSAHATNGFHHGNAGRRRERKQKKRGRFGVKKLGGNRLWDCREDGQEGTRKQIGTNSKKGKRKQRACLHLRDAGLENDKVKKTIPLGNGKRSGHRKGAKQRFDGCLAGKSEIKVGVEKKGGSRKENCV